MTPTRIIATYRLQMTRDFPLAAALARVPYLHDLGISHLYLSPILAAKAGSTHGYDVIDPARLNPDLGTEDDLRALAAALHEHGMGIIVDIVPNHMSASHENPYWDDVLERGKSSRYASWFDIDWSADADGKVVLPVLGDDLARVIERGELKLHIRDSGSRVAYFDKTFPLDGATLPREIQLAQLDPQGRPAAEEWASGHDGRRRLTKLLNAQNYRLVHWKRAPTDINYRRFFDVNDLVAVRMETEQVFDATHRKLLDWVREGILDGVRVDHIDGIRDPAWYLAKLQASVHASRHVDAHQPFPIFVEKILSGDELLPKEWPVDGTTGYDFMNEVEDLLLDARGWAEVEANYRGLRHNPSLAFTAIEREGKRNVLRGALRADVTRVARLLVQWVRIGGVIPSEARDLQLEGVIPSEVRDLQLDDAVDAVSAFIVHLAVYRTYVVTPGIVRDEDRAVLDEAFSKARAEPDVVPGALDHLRRAFYDAPEPTSEARTELIAKLQQTSGPAAAKGVEDTALYVYVPLASRNEVGGSPHRPLTNAAERAHSRNLARATHWKRSLNATNTHDTKRSADVRARLSALTEHPAEWARHVGRWRKLNRPLKRTVRGKPAPDTNGEYLFYQSLVGLWPAPRPQRRVDDLPDAAWMKQAADRLSAYMLKASREAKTRTSWTESDTQYEQALEAFVRESLAGREDAHFAGDVARLTAAVADDGFARSLARVILHLTSPGIPDIYQGDELWTFTLVDPDNRRVVDFDRATSLLARSTGSAEFVRDALAGSPGDDRTKQALVARLLQARREYADLFSCGSYMPIVLPAGMFGYGRRHNDELALVVARTTRSAEGTDQVRGVQVTIPGEFEGRWLSALTGREIELVGDGTAIAIWADELVLPKHPGDLLIRTRR
jgi:(1->4)-alpha-D-glucan 1-alpha-D-glucosylmutase